jgi:hypothetical protein
MAPARWFCFAACVRIPSSASAKRIRLRYRGVWYMNQPQADEYRYK